VHIAITLFLTYLPRPVPSDVQLFYFIVTQTIHIKTSFDCMADLVGQLRGMDRKECA